MAEGGLSRRRLGLLAAGLGLGAGLGAGGLLWRRGRRRVVVVGGGPGGLAAAREAALGGAEVVLLEASAALGGAAVYGQAITAIPGEAGLASWTEAAGGAEDLVRTRYCLGVREQVVDWLGALGVNWQETWNPHADGATLLQPEGGGEAVCAALQAAAEAAGAELRTGQRVAGLARLEEGGLRVSVEGAVGTGRGGELDCDEVILATGGFMGDLDETRARLGLGALELLRGAPASADGSGLELGAGLGGAVREPGQGILYAHGVPLGEPARAVMLIEAHRAWPLAPDGTPLPFLRSPRGSTGEELAAVGGEAWMIIDAPARRSMSFWDWQTQRMLRADEVIREGRFPAGRAEELAAELGLPLAALQAGVRGPGEPPPRSPQQPAPRPLEPGGRLTALPVRVTTAKSLTGLETDLACRVLDAAGQPVHGLYAVGEVAGFGHPYGGVPYDSTMVAGAVQAGRIAGAGAPRLATPA